MLFRTILLAAALALVTVAGTTSFASAQSADEVLSKFDDEPTVLEVHDAVLAYAGLDPDDSAGWTGRASAANVLPEQLQYRLRFRDRSQETDRFTDDLNADGSLLGSDRRDEDRTNTEFQHEVTARWNFAELIFNPDVLKAARELGRQAKLREDLLSAVTKIYYERRRAQVDMILDPPSDTADRLRRELRVQELTADIDGLTGGWYSTRLREIGKSPY